MADSDQPMSELCAGLECQSLLSTDTVAAPHDAVDGTDDDCSHLNSVKKCIEELTTHLRPFVSPVLSRNWRVLRMLTRLVDCPVDDDEGGRIHLMRISRSLLDRLVNEMILQHQNPALVSAHLWASVRSHGCQFLGPAMQEEVLRLLLLALHNGAALSRKVLVLFIVSKLQAQYSQASKTAIGHVVQLLYRASCFTLIQREDESSLMRLKEEFCTYESLSREHDSQIVQIAMEAGLRIAPEQWSSLLYGDHSHRSHMQSTVDKLQATHSLSENIKELQIALCRCNDPNNLAYLCAELNVIAQLDDKDESVPSWSTLHTIMLIVNKMVRSLVTLMERRGAASPKAN